MCRLMVYKGSLPMIMSHLLTHPPRSIITQSYSSRERIQHNPLNGDGFGVGWYVQEEALRGVGGRRGDENAHQSSMVPCVFSSVTPAWNDLNLKRLAEKVSSHLIFAHVRAAYPGMMVSQANCHPFQHGRFLWMHNGGIGDFKIISREARESLKDEVFDFIQGTTDSEMTFALFLNQLNDYMAEYTPEELKEKVIQTIAKIEEMTSKAGITTPSILNFAMTDGSTVIATRFASEGGEPASLYFSAGTRFECGEEMDYRMNHSDRRDHAVIITSEPLTDDPSDWVPVPKNHLVMITPDSTVLLFPIQFGTVPQNPVVKPKPVFLSDTRQTHSSCGIPRPFKHRQVSKEDVMDQHNCTFVMNGHKSSVLTLHTFSDYLFSGSEDKSIMVWNVKDFTCVKVLTGHTGSVLALCCSKGYLFSSSSDSTIRVWDLHSWQCKATFQFNVSSIFSLNIVGEQYLFSGHQDTTIRCMDITPFGNAKQITIGTGHAGYIYSLVSSKNHLFSGSGDGIIKVWNLDQFKDMPSDGHSSFRSLSGHHASVLSLCSTDDMLYSGSKDRTIKVWDMERFHCIRTLTGHEHDVISIAVSGAYIYSADPTALKIWDKEKMTCCQTVLGKENMFMLASISKGVILSVGSSIKVWQHSKDAPLKLTTPTSEDSHLGPMVDTLRNFVSIKSVSSDETLKAECWRAAKFLFGLLEDLGVETKLVEVTSNGKNPIILGRLGSNPLNPTIAIYGHYDVVPAMKADGWDTDPFSLQGKDGYLYGRGVSDDKGPIIATLVAIKEMQMESVDLGVNFVFIYEGEEENDSEGFNEAIAANQEWFEGTQLILIMNTYWIGDSSPCLIYGLRGVLELEIEIDGPAKDLHTGLHGGAVQEPFNDLVFILSQVIDTGGNILVPGFLDKVATITPEEKKLFGDLKLHFDSYKQSTGSVKAQGIEELLSKRWCLPSISITGTETSGKGSVISHKVSGKLCIRYVPDQTATELIELMTSYITKKFNELSSPNRITVKVLRNGEWWLGDRSNKFYKAAAKSIQNAWGQSPLYIREGGTIPVTPFLEKTLHAPALHFPMGQSSDRAHLQNERIRLENLLKGKTVLKHFFQELAHTTQS